LFPPLLLLPCRGALVGNRLDPGNVLAQAAQLLQTLSLSHVELKLQLKKLIAHFLFLVTKLFVSQISNFFCFHIKLSAFGPQLSAFKPFLLTADS
jgi:hypothetical protein